MGYEWDASAIKNAFRKKKKKKKNQRPLLGHGKFYHTVWV